jgi:hypothetical protein
VTGTLTEVAHPEAMAAVLWRENIRCFDIGQLSVVGETVRGAGVEYYTRKGIFS